MPQPAHRARILVIDDEEPIAQLLNDALTLAGHTVHVATSGRLGLRLAEDTAFDLVLTDLGMPDISGWEVASRIRERHPQLPVVLVTGWGTTVATDAVERYGIAAVVHKPFEIRELLATADAVLGAPVRASGVRG